MSTRPVDVIVAGHICLDVIPTIPHTTDDLTSFLVPGKLNIVGSAVISMGGAVSNTGLALHRLGVPVRLLGKIGNDVLGGAILAVLEREGPELSEGMIITPGETSSYTVVINPPNIDRVFLHYPGPNDTFCESDVASERLSNARHFHFGYPPLMRQFFLSSGSQLIALFKRAKSHQLTTSLDMAMVDPASEAGKVSWKPILAGVLPYVDVFPPSIDEVLPMLEDSNLLADYRSNGLTGRLLSQVGARLITMGSPVIAIKLGDQGLYVRTSPEREKLAPFAQAHSLDLDDWTGRELFIPGYRAKVVGTTGAGDCAIAGFITGFLKGMQVEDVLRYSAAVGACNVEAADAVSGIPRWEMVIDRVRAGWAQLPTKLQLDGWNRVGNGEIWSGPEDHHGIR